MARLNILKDPSPLLRKTSKPVAEFSARLHELLDDMTETMTHAKGVGIAAVQVGVLYRAAILLTEEHGTIEIINPTAVTSAQEKTGQEGCLSYPGIYGRVKRPQLLIIEFVDRNGKPRTLKLSGRDAVIAAHEMDHMDGVLFIDKMIK